MPRSGWPVSVRVVVPDRTGRVLDRRAADALVLGAFATLDRTPIAIPSRVDEPKVTADDLGPSLAKVRTAVSRPVVLKLGSTRYRVSRGGIGRLLAVCPRVESARCRSAAQTRTGTSSSWRRR